MRVTDWLAAVLETAAVNEILEAPAGTVVLLGIFTLDDVAQREMTAPPAGAAALNETVQVLKAPGFTGFGLQLQL